MIQQMLLKHNSDDSSFRVPDLYHHRWKIQKQILQNFKTSLWQFTTSAYIQPEVCNTAVSILTHLAE